MSFDHTIKKGTTNKQVEIVIRDSTTGQGKTGVAHSSVTAKYWREGASSGTAITMQSGTLGLYLSGSWAAVDGTNMPGVYQFSIPDAALASGADAVTISFTISGAIDKVIRIALIDVDFRDSVDMGLTGLGASSTEIADAVWDEARSGHTTAGTFGEYVNADTISLDGNTGAVTQLAASAGQIVIASVDTVTNGHTPTTTELQSDTVTEATDDHYNGRVIIFTSGALAGQATAIQGYTSVGGIGQFTVVALTEAPSDNDNFIIL